MSELECTRCGWCCQNVMVKMSRSQYIHRNDLEWMNARGIRIFSDQMIIPSRCPNLGAEQIGEKWFCRCNIQDQKPKECAEKPCIKNKYPRIADLE